MPIDSHQTEGGVLMKGPSTRKRGNVGESAVRLKLESDPFWWDIVDNSRNDRGVDLLALVHDPLLGNREVLVAIQVKSDKSKFNRPKKQADGEVIGWWYYESSKKHFDYWVEHDAPALLVLHDKRDGESYWVHVTRDAIVSTGKGARILVPRSQTISAECKELLLQAADRHVSALALEGSVIPDGLGAIPPERRLRYALVVPRLAAAHPQTALESPISACEAIALMAQGSFRELDEIADRHDEMHRIDAVPTDADWDWQVAGAIWNWLATNTTDRLESAYATAPDQHSATSSGVLLACALWRQERHRATIALLDKLVQRDHPDSLDRAWALVQRARFRVDRGDFDSAQADATMARQLLRAVHDDEDVSAPMASALAAGIARTSHVIAWTKRFREGTANAESTEAWVARQQEAFLELMEASDTAVSWWRSQDVALALGREQDSSFESWVEDDPPQNIRGSPIPETKLLSAELNADLTGEHGLWKALSARRGIQCVMRAASYPDTATELEDGLDALRRCGDSSRFTKSVRHLLRVGPLAPIAASTAKVPTSGWTHTTAKTNFEALALAGDLLGQSSADQLIEQCARAACGEPTELECVQDEGYFSLPSYATDAVAGVLPAASSMMHDRVAGYLAQLPEVHPVLFLRGLDRVLYFLNFNEVRAATRQALLRLADRDHDGLSASIRGWFVRHGDADVVASLKQAAARGDIYALAEMEDVSVFDESESTAVIEALEERVNQARVDALSGAGNSGNRAYCHALTRLNLGIPSAARWDPVVGFLGEPRTFIEDRRAICRALTAGAPAIPEEVRDQLVGVIDLAATGSASFWPGAEAAGMELRLRIALGAVSSKELEGAITRLALGSHQERLDACLILRSSACVNRRLLLRVLMRDPDFTVRYRATQTVAYLVAVESDDADVELAWDAASHGGRELPLAVLQGFDAASDGLGTSALEICQSLKQHPSAVVRRAVDNFAASIRRAREGEAIAASYRQVPQGPEEDASALANAIAMTEAEPW